MKILQSYAFDEEFQQLVSKAEDYLYSEEITLLLDTDVIEAVRPSSVPFRTYTCFTHVFLDETKKTWHTFRYTELEDTWGMGMRVFYKGKLLGLIDLTDMFVDAMTPVEYNRVTESRLSNFGVSTGRNEAAIPRSARVDRQPLYRVLDVGVPLPLPLDVTWNPNAQQWIESDTLTQYDEMNTLRMNTLSLEDIQTLSRYSRERINAPGLTTTSAES